MAYMDSTDNINENNLNSAGSPIDENEHSAKPTSLFGALSVIQRYYVIEKKSKEDLPKEYFTIEQTWDFMKVGVKSGFIESFLFITLLPFLQVIYPSFKYFFFSKSLSVLEKFILQSIAFLPIIVSTLFLLYLTKYYKGSVTKKALFSLFFGRSVSFFIKGVIIFYLFRYLYYLSYKSPNGVYSILDFLRWTIQWFIPQQIDNNVIYQYYYTFLAPALKQTANEMLVTMLFFALLPFITIFFKGYTNRKKHYSAQKQYDNY